jgi:hypothetical protein
MGTVFNKFGGEGGAKVINLGTGTSFNVSSISGYKNFTKNNFIVEPPEGGRNAGGSGTGVGFNYSKSYNSSTGDFRLSMKASTFTSTAVIATVDVSSSCKVWLVPNGVQ